MSSAAAVALVTGGNKGIGFHMVKQLATARPKWTVLLGSRDVERGEKAVKETGLSNVKFQKIIVDDKAQLASEAESIKKDHGEKSIAVLMANAGWAAKGDAFDASIVDETFKTNYYGLLHTIDTFLPLMADGGRIVVTSSASSVSAMRGMSPELREKFLKPDLSIDALTSLLSQFRSAVAAGTWEKDGWPKSAYGMSKVGASCATRVLSKTLPRGIKINCGCPGWCRTDMAGDKAPRSAEDGAHTLTHIAMLPEDDNTSGEFWEDKHVSSITREKKEWTA